MPLTIKTVGDKDRAHACPNRLCVACGGKPPYTWSISVGTITPQSRNTALIQPPANSGGFPGARAFTIHAASGNHLALGECTCDCGLLGTLTCTSLIIFDCDGNEINRINVDGPGPTCPPDTISFSQCGPPDPICPTGSPVNRDYSVPDRHCDTPLTPCFANPGAACDFGDGCIGIRANYRCIRDLRTDPMKAANCAPCELIMDGAVVTLTDADGVSVSRTLRGVSTLSDPL